jgi:hypothetical protein
MSKIVDEVLPARTTTHFIRLLHSVSPEIWDAMNRERTHMDVLIPDFPDECGFSCTGGPNLA